MATKVSPHPCPTLEDALGALDMADLIPDAWGPERGSLRVRVTRAFDRDGRIFVSCGGWAILRIEFYRERLRYDGEPMPANRRPAYIVIDDQAGKAWERRRQDGVPPHELGPKPSDVVRLAQSG